MTVLYRCRTALSEVARTFDAAAPAAADWSAEVWPGRDGLVVHTLDGQRRIAAMAWGVRNASFAWRECDHTLTGVWFRDIYRNSAGFLAPQHRCLIVLESFACPDGAPGARKRTWFGFEDWPIFAWAGFWTESRQGRGFCGFLVAANELVTASSIMPAIVAPSDYDAWLYGDLSAIARIARTTMSSETMYREPTEEPWGGDRYGGRD